MSFTKKTCLFNVVHYLSGKWKEILEDGRNVPVKIRGKKHNLLLMFFFINLSRLPLNLSYGLFKAFLLPLWLCCLLSLFRSQSYKHKFYLKMTKIVYHTFTSCGLSLFAGVTFLINLKLQYQNKYFKPH